MSHKKELLRSLWVNPILGTGLEVFGLFLRVLGG